MEYLSRRTLLATTAAAGIATGLSSLSAQAAEGLPQPQRPGHGGNDPGPRNVAIDRQNPDILVPPATDSGTLPNLAFSFSNAHVRVGTGGWTRQVTNRELPISMTVAGVDMRLNAGGIREMHWHKAAEWSYMLYGKARITAMDFDGKLFVEDVGVGDLWYFPPGVPHSIQGLEGDGCEFLLVFDDGGFDENNTFLLSDWIKHTPPEVLAKNFGMPASVFAKVPAPEDLYIFASAPPKPLSQENPRGVPTIPGKFSHRLLAQKPVAAGNSGSVRIADSSIFPASKTIAAAYVEVAPGAMREMHWHPNNDEWQYYIEGQGRMTVFAAQGQARTFDYRAGDVGYVPFATGHYIENTGTTPLRFLEIFKSDYYADVSFNQWLAVSPPELVKAHLNVDQAVIDGLRTTKTPIVPA